MRRGGGAWASCAALSVPRWSPWVCAGPLAAPVVGKQDDFPSLGVAAKVKETKKDKKKKQTMSLADFNKSTPATGGAFVPSSRSGMVMPRRGEIDLSALPSGPRARPEGEAPSERGPGGFGGDFGGERSRARVYMWRRLGWVGRGQPACSTAR